MLSVTHTCHGSRPAACAAPPASRRWRAQSYAHMRGVPMIYALLGSSEYPSRGRAPAPRRADLQAPRVARRSRSAEGQAAAGLRSTPISSCMHQDRSILTRITIPRFATVDIRLSVCRRMLARIVRRQRRAHTQYCSTACDARRPSFMTLTPRFDVDVAYPRPRGARPSDGRPQRAAD